MSERMFNMKKITALLLCLILAVGLLNGCQGKAQEKAAPKIAFITGIGTIEDHSFNEDSFHGVEQFSQEHDAEYKHFPSASSDEADLLAAIQQAVDEDFDVIVMAGYLFGKPCLEAAKANPDTLFLALAVTPAQTGAARLPSNLSLLTHREEQAGFLAGYAAVAEGYRELGFLGGVPIDAVVRFGHGFIQGAEQAAHAMEVPNVRIKHWYSGSFVPNEGIEEKMDTWFSEGTEVVFACGGAIYESALAAADTWDKELIGVDVDQSYISPRFITSATKSLSRSVILALEEAYSNHMTWPSAYAGTCQSLGVNNDCVGLAMENSHFDTFSMEMYELLYDALQNESFHVDTNTDPYYKPRTEKITVDWQE